MLTNRSVIRALAAGAAMLVADAAHAQQSTVLTITNRPSGQSASSRLGRTGGGSTRQSSSPLSLLRPGSVARLNATPRNPFLYSRNLPQIRMPLALQMGSAGIVPGDPAVSRFAQLGRTTRADLRRVSGFARGTRFSVPLEGLPIATPRFARSAYFAPRTEQTPFQRAFGIRAASQSPAGAEAPVKTIAELLDDESHERTVDTLRKGRELFRQATVSGIDFDARIEKLAEAITHLSHIRTVDEQAYIPSLLLAHACLAKRQSSSAIMHLLDAVERHPSLFVEQVDVASYFGDRVERDGRNHSEMLAQQARRVLAAKAVTRTANGLVMRAYCAWLLGDTVRVRRLVSELGDLNAGPQFSSRVQRFGFAMSAAADATATRR